MLPFFKSQFTKLAVYQRTKTIFGQDKSRRTIFLDYTVVIFYYYMVIRVAVVAGAIFLNETHFLLTTDFFMYMYAVVFSHWTYQLMTCFVLMIFSAAYLHKLFHLDLGRLSPRKLAFIREALVVNFEDFIESNHEVLRRKLATGNMNGLGRVRTTVEYLVDLARGGHDSRIAFRRPKLVHFPVLSKGERVRMGKIQCFVELLSKAGHTVFFFVCHAILIAIIIFMVITFPMDHFDKFQIMMGAYSNYPVTLNVINNMLVGLNVVIVLLFAFKQTMVHVNRMVCKVLLAASTPTTRPEHRNLLSWVTCKLLMEHNRIVHDMNVFNQLFSGILNVCLFVQLPTSMYPLIYTLYHKLTLADVGLFLSMLTLQAALFVGIILPSMTAHTTAHGCGQYLNRLQLSLRTGRGQAQIKYKVAVLYELVAHKHEQIGFQVGPFGVITKHAVFEFVLMYAAFVLSTLNYVASNQLIG